MNIPTVATFALFLLFSSCRVEEPCVTCPSSDTSSHSYSWDLLELGDGNGSVLHDVAIVRDNPPLVYAVGDISIKDSMGNWENTPYGVAIWNGVSWSIKKIFARYPNSTMPLRPTAIIAFSATDVWLAWGDVYRWNGVSDTVTVHRLTVETTNPNPVLEPGQYISRLWGNSNQNLYAIGSNGAIAFYNGATWTRRPSGTTLNIQDIWGNGGEILAVASDGFDRRLLRISGSKVTSVSDSGLAKDLSGIWFLSGVQYYLLGAGIHRKERLADPVWRLYPSGEVTSFHSSRIRGSSWNNIFVVGSYLEVAHFNGSTWYNYSAEIPLTPAAFASVSVSPRLAVAAGGLGPKALVAIGRRY